MSVNKKLDLPIYNKLKEIRDSRVVSFHMPGHKYGRIYDELGYSHIMRELYLLDTTEIIGTDNLHNPKGIIKKSQDNIKDIVFPNIDCEIRILVNGSTCGIEAAIMSSLKEGDEIIVNRACHQSTYNGILLAKAKPIYVKDYIDEENNIILGAREEDYIEAIENNTKAKAIFITRPTYHGMVFEIENLVKKAHENNMIVIVDEAHGAHFGLNEKFPTSAVLLGADIVIQSCHKTLPSFTQSSIMIVNNKNENLDLSRLNQMLNMTESSSPSYIMMMGVEICYDIYKKYGRVKTLKLLDDINRFKKSIKGYEIFETSDPTKIFINTIKNGINGYDFAKVLRYRYNIQVELSNYCGILMLCSIANDENDFEEMITALNEIRNKKLFGLNMDFFDDIEDANKKKINDNIKKVKSSRNIDFKIPYNIPKMKYKPHIAIDMETELISIEESIGRSSGDFVIPYPPGVCILSPGEIITEEIISYLKKAIEGNVDINGIDNIGEKMIRVIVE